MITFLKPSAQARINSVFLGCILSLISLSAFSQKNEKIVPTLVLLNPHNKIVPKEILQEIETKISDSTPVGDDSSRIAEFKNYDSVLLSKANIDNLFHDNFFSMIPKTASTSLGGQLYDYDPSFFAFPVSDACSGTKNELKAIAGKYHVKWLINIPAIKLSTEGTKKVLEIRLQLYDANLNQVKLDKRFFSKDSKEQACEDATWDCLALNTTMSAMNEVVTAFKKP